MKKPRCGQIKINKEKKTDSYNVTSSYQHLLEKISNELKLKQQSRANGQMKQMSNHKGSNNHSVNYAKKLSFSKGKTLTGAGTVSFESSEKNNERLNTDTNIPIKNSRDFSPGYCDTIKKLKIMKTNNATGNHFDMKNNSNGLFAYLKTQQPYYTNFISNNTIGNTHHHSNHNQSNSHDKKIKFPISLINPHEENNHNTNAQASVNTNIKGITTSNIDDLSSYEDDVCLTEPYQNTIKEYTIKEYNNFLPIKPKTQNKPIKTKYRQHSSLSQNDDVNHQKYNQNTTASNNTNTNNQSNSQSKHKKSAKTNSSQLNDIKQLNNFNDLNININTHINTNININTNTNPNPIPIPNTKTSPTRPPEIISINSLFNTQDVGIDLKNLNEDYPQYDQAKASTKSINNIKAYGANTYLGISRNYNEDRVSIILNIAQPPDFVGNWPKCSFFGIYDGHGGNTCADFLRDRLHSFIIKDKNFPSNPQEALKKGFEKAEDYFINNYSLSQDHSELIDKSGSCAIVALIIENTCFIANVGDSRGIISLNHGKDVRVLTTDHKPNEDFETKRIVANGGKIYQTQTQIPLYTLNSFSNANQILLGPFRVFPGRLSVSRTIGDAEAKLRQFGGLPRVVIAEPEITYFCIDDEIDFLMMGCDGIFDQLTNEEVSECVWTTFQCDDIHNVHSQCAIGVDMIMKTSLARKTLDNITVIMISFKNFEKEFNYCLAQRQYNNSLLSQNSNNNINGNDSYQNSVLVTEPTYNFAHEKLVKKDFKHKMNISHEKKLSPPNSSKNMFFNNNNPNQPQQKASTLQSRIPLSPKMKKMLKDASKNK